MSLAKQLRCGADFGIFAKSVCARSTMSAYRRLPVFITLVFAHVLVSGCATEQASLPDSSFNSISPAPSLTSALNDRESFRQNTDELVSRYAADGFTNPENQPGVPVHPERSVSPENDENPQSLLVKTRTYSVEAVDAPIEALLFSMANDADLQLELHGTVKGRVSLNARSKKLTDVLASLSTQVAFSWRRHGDVLSIWGTDSYSDSYAIDYLNISRRTQSSVGLATQVGTINATTANSGGSVANSSSTLIENTSEHRFWESLNLDVQNMMAHSTHDSTVPHGSFSINREAGLLNLYAEPGIHRNVQRYLELLHDSSQRQVLIEATVVEVALSDNYDAGVDWQVLAKGISGLSAAQVLVGAPLVNAQSAERISAPSGLVSFVHEGGDGDLSATLSLLEQFGDVRILSRPRIIALNNQSSVLKVVDNKVYFTVSVQRRQQVDEEDEVVTETQIHTVPVGLVMNVTPQISREGRVMLNVRPTLSRILGFVNDPNPELAIANVRNGVPEIQVREMESMLQVQSGDVAIIGGLMQETQSDSDARLPGLGLLPGVGRLFSRKSRERRQTELLIVLRPTVLDSADRVSYR